MAASPRPGPFHTMSIPVAVLAGVVALLASLPSTSAARYRGPVKQPGQTLSLASYGAKGDGSTDDSGAISKAFAAACGSSGAVTLLFPSSAVFLSKYSLLLSGPCTASPLTIQLDGTLQFDAKGRAKSSTNALLELSKINALRVLGSGRIHGKGSDWWPRGGDRPHLLQFTACNDVQAMGFTTVDPPKVHMVFQRCTHVVAQGLTTSAPYDSPNTDSIHLSTVVDGLISNNTLFSGDDCVSIVQDSQDLVIQNLVCTAGHGYSIGSLGYGADTVCMSNITVRDSYLENTTNGLRIKTYQGGQGLVSGVTFQNIRMKNVQRPIMLDQFYCDKGSCSEKKDAVALYNIAFSGVTGTTADKGKGQPGGISLSCSATVPCSNLVLQDISIAPVTASSVLVPLLSNAFGAVQNVVSPKLTQLSSGQMSSSQRTNIIGQALKCGTSGLKFSK